MTLVLLRSDPITSSVAKLKIRVGYQPGLEKKSPCSGADGIHSKGIASLGRYVLEGTRGTCVSMDLEGSRLREMK